MAVRIIKKYPNRRLYDTAASRYITLRDIRQRVIEGEDLQVLDARNGQDITRSILLMVGAEQRGEVERLLNVGFLRELIRSGISDDLRKPGDGANPPPGPASA